MKIINLTQRSPVYTSNVYLLTGTWNALSDVNTLIDAGRDPQIFQKISEASTGVGKRKVEQVILTHSHYDHTGMIKRLKEEYNPKILAFSATLEGVDHVLKDGEKVKAGDGSLTVIHMPGHSTDSILLYDEENKYLFAGDTPLIITSPGSDYEEDFIRTFERLCHMDIQTIYFGHGEPCQENAVEVLRSSYQMICCKN